MRHTFLDVNRIEMRRWSRGFGATALINRNIHHHTAGFHLSQHCARDQLRRFGSRQKHGADEQIAIGHQVVQICFVRIKRVQVFYCDIEKSQPFDIDVENCDIGTEAFGHTQGVHARSSAAENDHAPGQNSRNAAEQNSAASIVFGEKIGAHYYGHATGNFAHRLQ